MLFRSDGFCYVEVCSFYTQSFEFFFKINLFICLFLAVLDLRCCTRAFSGCGKRGLLFIAVRGLLIAVASLVAEHELLAHRLNSCGSWTLECRLSSCGARA